MRCPQDPQPWRSRSGARVSEGPGLARPQSKTRRVMSMSIKFTDTQLVLLSAAAQREDRCLVASPTLKGGAAQKVASKLISTGLVKEVKAKSADPIWRRDEESGASYALKLTAAGAKAIAVDDAVAPEDAGQEGDALADRDQAAIPPKLEAKDARPAEGTEPGPAGPSAPRGGSKLAQVIELLQRDHGATVDELIAATGWLAHAHGNRELNIAVAIAYHRPGSGDSSASCAI